jgi:tellurite resistance protein TehA-like permease
MVRLAAAAAAGVCAAEKNLSLAMPVLCMGCIWQLLPWQQQLLQHVSYVFYVCGLS